MKDRAGQESKLAAAESDVVSAGRKNLGAESRLFSSLGEFAGKESNLAAAESDVVGAEMELVDAERKLAGKESELVGNKRQLTGDEEKQGFSSLLRSPPQTDKDCVWDYKGRACARPELG